MNTGRLPPAATRPSTATALSRYDARQVATIASVSLCVGMAVGFGLKCIAGKWRKKRIGHREPREREAAAAVAGPHKPVLYIGAPPPKVKSWRSELLETSVPTKWLKMRRAVVHMDNTGREQDAAPLLWEYVERPHSTSEGDGCDVIATLKTPGKPEYFILVLNYRVPVNRVCVEFPSGLIDEGEPAIQAALRELKEETGYTGQGVSSTKLSYIDPYKSSESLRTVFVDVNGSLPENQQPVPEREQDEYMQVLLVQKGILLEEIERLCEKGYGVDSKVYSYALGLRTQSDGGTKVSKSQPEPKG